MIRRFRRWLFRGLTLLLLAFLIMEIALQLFFPQYKTFTQPDDLLRFSLIPGASYTFVAEEGCPGWQSSGVINSHGLQDDERSWENPQEDMRILAIGDSFTEALQFERDSRWTDLLEVDLNTAGAADYDVINAGLSGTGTTQHYLYYTERLKNYQPDMTILMFSFNDFSDNLAALHFDPLRPYHHLDDSGDLVLDMSFVTHPGYERVKQVEFFRQNFHSYQFLRSIWWQRRFQNTIKAIAVSPERQANQIEAIEITEALILALRDAVEADGSEFLLVIGTVPEDDWLPAFEAHYPAADTQNIDEIMTAFAEENDVDVLNPVPLQRQYAAETGNETRGCPENNFEGHWNRAGHRIAADAIFAYLRADD